MLIIHTRIKDQKKIGKGAQIMGPVNKKIIFQPSTFYLRNNPTTLANHFEGQIL